MNAVKSWQRSRGRFPWRLALALPLLLSSCVFLLDFDELQGGHAKTADAGALPEAGADGAVAPLCPDACNDHDPCTVDTCDSAGASFLFVNTPDPNCIPSSCGDGIQKAASGAQ